MTEQWQELKETIIEMRDNDGTCTQQEVCEFLSNLMDVLEKQIASKLENAELARDSEETCNNKQVISKLVASDGTISRQAAIEKIHWLGLDSDTAIKCDLAIRALPSVNSQEQKTGHWILLRNDNGARCYRCSLCGHWHPLHDHSLGFRYCNWCGAKMESEG